jgi:hypothetical protein
MEHVSTRIYALSSGHRQRAHNLILHRNRRIYGDSLSIGCSYWVFHGGELLIVNAKDYARFVFSQVHNDAWVYKAPSNWPKLLPVRRDPVRTTNGKVIKFSLPHRDCKLVEASIGPRDATRFQVVIAKYKEDVAWAEVLEPSATVYSKDPAEQGRYRVLPNAGREGGTYLYHIVRHYDDLAERTLFLQGDPFPHPLLPLDVYASSEMPFVAGSDSVQNISWTVPWSIPTQPITEHVMRDFLGLVECDSSISHFRWTQGAQFAVARQQIRKRPKSYYQRLLDISQRETVELAGRRFNNHQVAWIFELFWRNIFLGQESSDLNYCSSVSSSVKTA